MRALCPGVWHLLQIRACFGGGGTAADEETPAVDEGQVAEEVSAGPAVEVPTVERQQQMREGQVVWGIPRPALQLGSILLFGCKGTTAARVKALKEGLLLGAAVQMVTRYDLSVVKHVHSVSQTPSSHPHSLVLLQRCISSCFYDVGPWCPSWRYHGTWNLTIWRGYPHLLITRKFKQISNSMSSVEVLLDSLFVQLVSSLEFCKVWPLGC